MDGPKDDLKWFGEGFDGFPKHLPEDCVEYMLFIIDSRLNSQKEILQRLEIVRKAASKFQGQLLKKYIWQRDSYDLNLKIESGRLKVFLDCRDFSNSKIRVSISSWSHKLW